MTQSASNEQAVRDLLAKYNAALNEGRTEAVMPLYTADGIFMAPFSESSIGFEAIRSAYDRVFAELKFDVVFTIHELVRLTPQYAYVRTNSAGSTQHSSTGQTTSEANQELFILRRDHGEPWRIARYSFSPTNPPQPSTAS